MTTLTFKTHSHHAPNAIGPSLLGLLRQEWDYWLASRALHRLDDEALHDVGIARGAIDEAVRHGRPTAGRR